MICILTDGDIKCSVPRSEQKKKGNNYLYKTIIFFCSLVPFESSFSPVKRSSFRLCVRLHISLKTFQSKQYKNNNSVCMDWSHQNYNMIGSVHSQQACPSSCR